MKLDDHTKSCLQPLSPLIALRSGSALQRWGIANGACTGHSLNLRQHGKIRD